MKHIIVLITILIPVFCIGQVSKSDSLELLAITKTFKTNVLNRDRAALLQTSLSKVHCVSCFNNPSAPPKTYRITIDKFINACYDTLVTSRLFKCIGMENPWIVYTAAKGSEFADKNLRKNKEVIIYEVFYLTTKPNEIMSGHEGQSTALQFVKIGSDFKLYGLTTVP